MPVGGRKRRPERTADRRAQVLPRGKDRVGIDIVSDLARDVGIARRRERERDEGRLERSVGQVRAERCDEPVVDARRAARPQRRDARRQKRHRQRLHRLPAVEGIAIVRRKETQIVGLDRQRQLDRRREAAIDRGDRRLGNTGEDEALARCRQLQHGALERT